MRREDETSKGPRLGETGKSRDLRKGRCLSLPPILLRITDPSLRKYDEKERSAEMYVCLPSVLGLEYVGFS